jgi:hypothetical protein
MSKVTFNPVPSEEMAQLQEDYLHLKSHFADTMDKEIDLSPESVEWVSDFMGEYRELLLENGDEAVQAWTCFLGAYLGFALIERYEGDWKYVQAEGVSETLGVRFPNGASTFPFGRAHRHIVEGSGDDIHTLYRSMEAILAES